MTQKSLVALIRKLVHVISIILPEPLIKEEYLTRADRTPVTEKVVQYVKKIAEGYDLEEAVVYCVLRTTTIFQREGLHDETKYEVCKQREMIARFLAIELLHLFPDTTQLYLQVLTKRYVATLGTLDDDPTSALEFALDHGLIEFTASPLTIQCVTSLWDGNVLLADEKDDGSLTPANIESSFVTYENRSNPSFWAHVDPVRLTVPKYQSLLELSLFIVFLGVYTYVINHRPNSDDGYPDSPVYLEVTLYLFVFGYIFDDIRQLYKGGLFYLQQLWNWLNILFVTIFAIALTYRLRAIILDNDHPDYKRYNDIAFDLMATVAVVLWMRILTMLDGFRFIGTMTVVLESMIKEGFLFFFMAVWIFAGFVQTFYALDNPNTHPPSEIVELLLKAFFQQPDFDTAGTYHPILGKGLLMVYIFTTLTILLNLLIALFNDGYSKISSAAHAEYLKRFTYKVFHYLRAEDHYPFTAPFNLLEVFVIIPLGFILSPRTYKHLNKAILTILFGGPLLLIGAYETWRLNRAPYRKLPIDNYIGEVIDDNAINEDEVQEIKKAVRAGGQSEEVKLLTDVIEDQKRLRAELEDLRQSLQV